MNVIHETTASALEVNALCEKIAPVLIDQEETIVLMALLSLILCIQQPEISHEDLLRGVKEVSQHICVWLDTTDAAKALNGPTIVH